MATLKQHQAAMVELLAHGTAIPASASRLAHALHDVLSHINGEENAPEAHTERRSEATTSGLNDAALAYDLKLVSKAPESHKTYIRELEQLMKQRDNTIRQLRESNAKLRDEKEGLNALLAQYEADHSTEQAGCHKEDTQVTDDGWVEWSGKGGFPAETKTFVEVKHKDGHTSKGFADQYYWSHPNLGRDIIAYRIVGESK